jgi:hypothetical protein
LTSPRCTQTRQSRHDNNRELPYATFLGSGGEPTERNASRPGPRANPRISSAAQPTCALVIWVTAIQGYADHCVTLEHAATAVSTPGAIYESLCGARFVPAPISTPPARMCPRCALLNQRRTANTAAANRLFAAVVLRIRQWFRT